MSRCRSYGCLGRAPRPLQSALDTTRAANSTAAAWLPAAMCIAALGPCRHRQKRHPGAAGAGVGGALHEAARLDPGSHRRKRQRVVSPKSLTSALAGATEVQTRRPPAKAGVLRKRKRKLKLKLKPKPKLCSGTTPRLNTTRGRPAAKAVSVPIATHRAYASVYSMASPAMDRRAAQLSTSFTKAITFAAALTPAVPPLLANRLIVPAQSKQSSRRA